ncbi:hypothetical protein [Curtobacterium sp. PhB78]
MGALSGSASRVRAVTTPRSRPPSGRELSVGGAAADGL